MQACADRSRMPVAAPCASSTRSGRGRRACHSSGSSSCGRRRWRCLAPAVPAKVCGASSTHTHTHQVCHTQAAGQASTRVLHHTPRPPTQCGGRQVGPRPPACWGYPGGPQRCGRLHRCVRHKNPDGQQRRHRAGVGPGAWHAAARAAHAAGAARAGGGAAQHHYSGDSLRGRQRRRRWHGRAVAGGARGAPFRRAGE
jgi:hypothetical protein